MIKKYNKKTKKAQEQIAGFALILVVLAIIMLAFLAATLRKPSEAVLENYETSNFLQSVLQQTTRCEMESGYLDIKDLIFECNMQSQCLNNEQMACDVLRKTLENILENSWDSKLGPNGVYTGYEFAVLVNGEFIEIGDERGNIGSIVSPGAETSANMREASQTFPKSGDEIRVYFRIYYSNK